MASNPKNIPNALQIFPKFQGCAIKEETQIFITAKQVPETRDFHLQILFKKPGSTPADLLISTFTIKDLQLPQEVLMVPFDWTITKADRDKIMLQLLCPIDLTVMMIEDGGNIFLKFTFTERLIRVTKSVKNDRLKNFVE